MATMPPSSTAYAYMPGAVSGAGGYALPPQMMMVAGPPGSAAPAGHMVISTPQGLVALAPAMLPAGAHPGTQGLMHLAALSAAGYIPTSAAYQAAPM